MKNRIIMSSFILAISIGCTQVVLASEGRNWDPVASDKLIKLPANIIEKRIQQDFEASPMALHIVELEQQMQDKHSQLYQPPSPRCPTSISRPSKRSHPPCQYWTHNTQNTSTTYNTNRLH